MHCIIQNIIWCIKQLFCTFVDYEKCFDTIQLLIQKLITSGLSSKFDTMVKSLHTYVISCIKVSNDVELSDFINILEGLKQGEP